MLQRIQLHEKSSHGGRRFTRSSFWPCKGVNMSWWYISFSAFFLFSQVYDFCLNCSLFLEHFFFSPKYQILISLKARIFSPDLLATLSWNIIVSFEWQRWHEPLRCVCSNIPLCSGLQVLQCFRGLSGDLLWELSKSPAVTLGRWCLSKQSRRAFLTFLCLQMWFVVVSGLQK